MHTVCRIVSIADGCLVNSGIIGQRSQKTIYMQKRKNGINYYIFIRYIFKSMI